MMAARAQKHRVEVVSQRTETTTTYANPDGTWTEVAYSGPVRYRDTSGAWKNVDPALVVQSDGSVAAKGSALHLTLAGRTAAKTAAKIKAAHSRPGAANTPAVPLVTMDNPGGHALTVSWRGALTAPQVTGTTARYVDALPHTDLVVDSTRTGFEQFLKLKDRSAVDANGSVTLTLTAKGLKANAKSDGAVVFTDTRTGKQAGVLPAPTMWDAAADPTPGEHAHTGHVGVKIAQKGSRVDLTLTPDQSFLSAPSTVYPVTVDPAANWTPAFNTFVEDSYTVDESTSTQLRLGYDGHVARSFMNFDMAKFTGKDIQSAKLNLWETYSATCTATPWEVWGTSHADTTVRWTNQPTWQTKYATSSGTKGFSTSCAAGWVNADITSLAKLWAAGSNGTNALGLRASSETDTNSWKIFSSGNASSNIPYIAVTYNSTPGTPTGMSASPLVTATTGTIKSTSASPTLSAKSTDADGGNVTLTFEVSHDPAYTSEGTGVMWTGTKTVASGATGSVTMPTTVIGSTRPHIQWRVKASDGTDTSAWSGYSKFAFNVTPPTAPTIICPDFAAGVWSTHTGNETCTIDTTSTDGAGYYWALDNPNPTTKLADPAKTGGNPLTVTINPAGGSHTLYAKAYDDSYNQSTVTAYAFGVGNGSVQTPADGDRTQASVALTSRAGAPSNQVTYQYHVGELASAPWATVPVGDVTLPGTNTHPTWPQTRTDTSKDFTELDWNVAQTLANAGKGDGPVQIEACFQTNGGTQSCSLPVTVTVERTAFGASYATKELGPGTASLLTGDYSLSDTDVNFGELTVSRTHTTLSPPAANTGATGIFGPGWTSSLPGSELAGAADYTLEDHSADGYALLIGEDGDTLTYVQQGTTTTYSGISDAADGSVLSANAASSPTSYTLTDTDGTTTKWTKSGSTWGVSQVVEPGANGTTSFVRDGQGRVTQMTAPAPAGVSCTTLVRGCRALSFTYATTTTATGTAETQWATYTGLVSQITYTAWDPATSAMKPVVVAQYLYDSTGHLRASWDPRISPALKTRYTYDASGRISTLTPPGLVTWTLGYDSKGRIVSASRPDPAHGTATQTIAYGLPITGSGAPIDLSGTQTKTWGQTTDLPVTGAAVFPASHIPATGSGGDYAPTTGDWKYADLSYLDVNGREVNTASYGAGAWQIDTTRYDAFGHTVWQLSAGNRAQALAPTADTDPYVAAQADSVTRANLLATTSTYTTDGADLISTLGPTHPVQLADGTIASAQVQTTSTYDESKPDSTAYHLVTTTVTTPVVVDGNDSHVTAPDTRTTLTGYNPIDGKPATDPTSGWVLRKPTTQTTLIPAAPDIVTETRYDSNGNVLESRMPASSGTDAGTTLTTYYTSAANSTYPECGNHAEWDGLVCRAGPAAQPTGTTMPVKEATYANEWALPDVVTQTSGSTVRTTTTSYDGAGRRTGMHIAVTPEADGGTPIQDTMVDYDPNTGLQTTVTSADSSVITTGYDSLGRATSYTDADGNQTTTTYTIDGQAATVDDGKGITTYTYDGTDAAGNEEHRGLVTRLDSGTGAAPGVFTGAYDANGKNTLQKFPNGMTATTTYDNTDQDTTLTYTMSTWANPLVFSQTASPFGQTVAASSPQSQQTYTYDPAGRLTQVQDQDVTANTCHIRSYGFNTNTDRTSLTDYPDAGDGTGACTTATTPTITNHSYDTADRIADTGYSYDALGRTLTVPATDVTGGSALNVGYYANDMVASLTQGAESKTFTLDPAMRPRTATDTGGAQPGTITNHYSADSDSPAWIAEADGSWTRNITGLAGELSAIQKSDGTIELQVANMHGDAVATVADDPAAVGTDSYGESTEYGTPRADDPAPGRYGWLGGKQRSGDALGGVVLMGARLYDPTSGRFLSVDPIVGGNANAYEYGGGDPVNRYDLDGRSSKEAHEAQACWSLGWSNCVFVMYLSGILSWNITSNHGRNNAIRHFIWQASLTYFFGAGAAKRLGDAHEWGEKCPRHGRCDTEVDQHNNRVARIFESSSSNRRHTRYWLNRGLLFQYLYAVGDYLYRYGYLW